MDNKKITKETYNNIAKQYVDSFLVNEEDLIFYDLFMKYTPKGKVLDLGCGNGQASGYLTKFGYECIGYDYSEEMIKLGRKYNPHLDLRIGDIEYIPLHDDLFEGAVYAYGLTNLTNKQVINSLNSCNKNLKSNGKLLILTFEGNTKRYEPEPFNPSLNCYINLFTKDEITDLLNKTGFKVEHIETIKETSDNASGSIIMCILATKIN